MEDLWRNSRLRNQISPAQQIVRRSLALSSRLYWKFLHAAWHVGPKMAEGGNEMSQMSCEDFGQFKVRSVIILLSLQTRSWKESAYCQFISFWSVLITGLDNVCDFLARLKRYCKLHLQCNISLLLGNRRFSRWPCLVLQNKKNCLHENKIHFPKENHFIALYLQYIWPPWNISPLWR